MTRVTMAQAAAAVEEMIAESRREWDEMPEGERSYWLSFIQSISEERPDDQP